MDIIQYQIQSININNALYPMISLDTILSFLEFDPIRANLYSWLHNQLNMLGLLSLATNEEKSKSNSNNIGNFSHKLFYLTEDDVNLRSLQTIANLLYPY